MNLDELTTPCFIIDEKKLEENMDEFNNALKKYYPNGVLAYSVKTNSLGYILEKVKKRNLYAEVVSYDEYNLVEYIGFKNKVIYNGPLKSKETFCNALKNGAYVNIESFREIEWLKNINKVGEYHLGIRLNINLNDVSPEDAGKNGESRFGFDYQNGEFMEAVERIKKYGFEIKGIHMHRTSATRSLEVYANECYYVSKIIEQENLNLEYIDIGGGFYGHMQGKPSYEEYIEVIYNNLCVDRKLTLILEPGNGIIASPVCFMMSIYDSKTIDGKCICLADGSRIDIDPLFHKKFYIYKILSSYEKKIEEKKQIVTGCTCLENDRIFEIQSNSQKIFSGDRIMLYDVGAYTMALSPNFIRFNPNVYVDKGNGEYVLVRKKWTYREMIQGHCYKEE